MLLTFRLRNRNATSTSTSTSISRLVWRCRWALVAALVIATPACTTNERGPAANGSTVRDASQDSPNSAATIPAAPIPMASPCFWAKGVARGANNTQYPDDNATYGYTSYTVPAGDIVRLSGEFAHAR